VSERTLLFVAPQSAPFGETVLGMRIADELHARGDQIVLFAHESLAILVKGRPFRFVPVPEGARVGEAIAAMGAELQAAAIVLLDATGVYMLLKREGTDATFLRTVGRRVIGLDVWNLRRTGLAWDLAGSTWQHSKYSLDVHRRLIPVPFAAPSGTKGLYDALPPAPEIDEAERAELRADLGVRDEDRLVLFTSARWQEPASQADEIGKRLASLFPSFVAERLAQAGERVHVLHVGPTRMPFDEKIGDRYTWLPQRAPQRFAKMLAAADVLLSFNFSATTIASAIAGGIPVLLGVSSHAGKTADSIAARLPTPPSPFLRTWLEAATPLPAFRVWPLGLFNFLAPLAKNNPYTTAVETAELFDEPAFDEALRRMIFDDDARSALRARQAKYRAEVQALPKASELVETYLES